MTGQDLLDRMELLNAELQLQSGEADVTKGLLALNVAQDYFESLAAQRADIFGGSTGSLTASSDTETTAFPSGVLRIDRIQMLDDSSRPIYDLSNLKRVGGHRLTKYFPLYLVSSTQSGKPKAYYTNGTSIYWAPLPSGTSSLRYYGFSAASNITAVGTFAYPDIVALPLAAFAVKLVKSGLEDPVPDIENLAQQTFTPTLDALSLYNRDGAAGFQYTQVHTE